MSLDFYLRVPTKVYYTRENGKTVEKPFYDTDYESKHVDNITHNLGEMARHIPVSDELTLYDVLWRPDEHNIKITDDLYPLIEVGVKYMIEHRTELEMFNPDNGWGDFDGLLIFSRHIGAACLFTPNTEIEVSR